MKTFLFALAALSSSSIALADGDPKVQCRIDYQKVTPQGQQLNQVSGFARAVTPEKPLTLVSEGVTLTATLTEHCIVDGGQCSGNYELDMLLSKDGITAGTSVSTPFFRQSLILKVGQEKAIATCLIMPEIIGD